MPQLHCHANLHRLSAARAEISRRHRPQVIIFRLEITPRRDVAEVRVITIGACNEVLPPQKCTVRQDPNPPKSHRPQ